MQDRGEFGGLDEIEVARKDRGQYRKAFLIIAMGFVGNRLRDYTVGLHSEPKQKIPVAFFCHFLWSASSVLSKILY